MKLLYLDSSAIVKLVVREPESEALAALIADWPERVSSELARVEVMRAARRAEAGGEVLARAEEVLARIGLIHVDGVVLEIAASLAPRHLRTLGAMHIATALSVKDDLGAIVAYDERVKSASEATGIKVLSPGG
ncbi:MAG: type II toxin-antitoxin system VapC family toxin [Actinomycetota bacterium]|nr:type II toxin-antitoxin system VapC family toxin [Rubrobacter sp.]MDQ3508693.1 type II toxin-antitoxin system VapC family toxin [Actinomycetota bacterium]